MVWRLLERHDENGVGDVLNEFVSAVVAFDPNAGSKAQIIMMQAELNKLFRRLADAEAEMQRDLHETRKLVRTYRRYLEAAQVIERKFARALVNERRGELKVSLIRLIDQLEWMKPELARARKADQAAQIWIGELRASSEELASKLKRAHDDRPLIKHPAEIAARQRGAKMATGSGLTSALTAISVKLDSLNRVSERMRSESEAFERRANVPTGDRLEHDPHIAAALGATSPKRAMDASVLRDRLSRLQEQQPAPPAATAA